MISEHCRAFLFMAACRLNGTHGLAQILLIRENDGETLDLVPLHVSTRV